MKRTITIEKDEYTFYDDLIRDENKLDDYGYNETIEKYFTYFESDYEILVEIINDFRPYLKATLIVERVIKQTKKFFFHMPELIQFHEQGQDFVVEIIPY